MTRRRRRLSEEEKELWAIVAKTVEPLHVEEAKPTPAAAAPVAAPIPGPPPPPGKVNRKKQAPEALPATIATKPQLPPLHPIERRGLSRVARGMTAIDGRIDLHGLTQLDAHDRLRGYLMDAQARGAKLILVITGKGKAADGGEMLGQAERGVLRRRVPHWLAEPGLRNIVIGFQEAHQTHGGGGALYVRIRKKRGAG